MARSKREIQKEKLERYKDDLERVNTCIGSYETRLLNLKDSRKSIEEEIEALERKIREGKE